SLSVKRALESQGAEALGLELLAPDELADALQQVQFATLNGSNDAEDDGTGELREEISLHDMRTHGIITEEMDRSYEDFYREPEPEPEARPDFFGDRQFDNSDFFPNADDDPWR